MTHEKPLVSMGMPVYNGERFIRRALDSLLAQDYDNFELIISDNASTDSTAKICHEYLTKDKRIRYYRNETNQGSVKNFNRVFELSRGKYFMWAAADDWHEPAFISRCLEVLEEDPAVILAYPLAVIIDEDGKKHGPIPRRLDTRDWDGPFMRGLLAMLGIYGTMIYGLFRADALKRTRLLRNILDLDFVLLFELSLIGKFAYIPEPLFYRRRIQRVETARERHRRRWLETLDPKNRVHRAYFPHWRTFLAYLNVAWHAPLDFRKKPVFFLAIFFLTLRRYRKHLMERMP